MAHYKYLIIGGGMTADAAAQGIRELDYDGTIGLIGEEKDLPYNRPPLSKGLWKGKPFESIWRHSEKYNIDFHLGRRAQGIDVQAKQVTDDQGGTYTYDKLLLATGGRPHRLPFGQDLIIYYRTLADYRRLYADAQQRRRFAVIGGGFIGSEIAAALAMNGKEVTLIFPGLGIGGYLFPPELSKFLNDYYRQKDVRVLTGDWVTGFEQRGQGHPNAKHRVGDPEELVLHTSRDRQIVVDGVVAGLGIEPNVELAEQAGLTLENGIYVDELLRTSQPDVYAAGDVAMFYSPELGRNRRVEHEDNANVMGRMAGQNMAGASEPYHYLPYFYSDLFDLGYEAVGAVDSRLQVVADWEEPLRKGIIYYLERQRVRGVLLWNVWEQVEAARELLATMQEFRPEDLKGRLRAAR